MITGKKYERKLPAYLVAGLNQAIFAGWYKVDQSTNQPFNQSTSRPINWSANQPFNQSTDQPIN